MKEISAQVLLEVEREGFKEVSDKLWNPYAAWWIEDENGNLVKLIYLTYFDDNTQGVNTLAGCEKSGYLSSLTFYTQERSFGSDVYCPWAGETREGLNCGLKPYTPWDVDGITGCSAPNTGRGNTDVMTRSWDLTDRDGRPVAAGMYYFMFNSVIRDESKDPSDLAWRVPIEVGKDGYTAESSQPHFSGSQAVPGDHRAVVRVTAGAMDAAGGSSGGSRAPDTFPNERPGAPRVEAPEKPGFCGGGSTVSAFMVLAWVGLSGLGKRRRRP